MAIKPRSTQQTFLRFSELPHVELRRTVGSTRPYKPHSHPQFSMGAIDEGTTQVQYKGTTRTANAGDLVFIDAQQVHSCCPLNGLPRSYSMLYISNSWCLDILSRLYQNKVKSFSIETFSLRDPSLLGLYTMCVSSLENGHWDFADIQLRSLLLSVLTRYSSAHFVSTITTEHRLTQRLRERLLQDLESPRQLESYAAELDCRSETLIRLFKKDTGQSPRAFQNNARIESAKLLLQGGNSICDTAQQLGFSDQSHFHRTFLNYTAATPRQYQQIKSI